jgi:predicted acyltransferase (DUF342 family)
MAFQPLSTANTFTQWVTETQRSVSVLNQFTGGGNAFTFYSNTNVEIDGNLNVGENLTVGGFLILDEIGYNDLNVAGNASIQENLTSTGAFFSNLHITDNVFLVNTSSLRVGTDVLTNELFVSGTFNVDDINIDGDIIGTSNLFVPNLKVSQNVDILNVTSSMRVGTEVTVYGDLIGALSGDGLSLTGDLFVDVTNLGQANIFSLIGTANTNIYNNIFASNAYTSVQNTLAEFASLTCILG